MVNPWKTYVKLSAVLMGSHGLTRASLTFLNYPAQLMFKLAKHPYVYGVLVFEAMATFIGQVSVLPLIALFDAATTTMITTARNAVIAERTLLAYKSSQESEG